MATEERRFQGIMAFIIIMPVVLLFGIPLPPFRCCCPGFSMLYVDNKFSQPKLNDRNDRRQKYHAAIWSRKTKVGTCVSEL